LLAADKGSRTQAQFNIKIKSCPENVFAEKSVLSCLSDGNVQSLYRNGVLCPDVNVTLGGADGVARNGHGLQHYVGIARQPGAVQERSRVALVGVTTHLFLLRLVCGGKFPLQSRGEAGSSSSPKAAVQQDLDHVLGLHLCEHLPQRLVSA